MNHSTVPRVRCPAACALGFMKECVYVHGSVWALPLRFHEGSQDLLLSFQISASFAVFFQVSPLLIFSPETKTDTQSNCLPRETSRGEGVSHSILAGQALGWVSGWC